MKINGVVVRGAAVGALGGLLFGFDSAVIAGTTRALTAVFQLSPQTLGVTVAIALCGTVLGAVVAGPLESRYGGRAMLRWMALFYLASAIGCAFSPNWTMLMVARFFGGIGIGGSSVIAPVYIAEIAPGRLRGRLVGLFQINVVAGVLVGQLRLVERAVKSGQLPAAAFEAGLLTAILGGHVVQLVEFLFDQIGFDPLCPMGAAQSGWIFLRLGCGGGACGRMNSLRRERF